MKFICFSILFFNITFINAQIDTPQYLTKSLAQRLIQNIDNDSLKVKAIYHWITSNIQYDHTFRRRIEGDTTLTQEPDYVVASQKAVCIGYAKLVREMCSLVDIQAVIVEGFVKDDRGNIESEEHAWNAVKINNNWYLLDFCLKLIYITWVSFLNSLREYALWLDVDVNPVRRWCGMTWHLHGTLRFTG